MTSSASALTCTTLTRALFKGSENKEVLALQEFLAEGGYLTVKPNGYFGENSRKAVIAFQSKENISVTGTVGPITRAKIKAVSCVSMSASQDKKVPTDIAVTKKEEKVIVAIKDIPVVIVTQDIPTIYVQTLFPSAITSSEATLKGSGGIDGEKHWFEWGLAMGTTTLTPQTAASTTFSYKITGLSPGIMYYYRAVTSVATSSVRKGETAYGDMRFFTTPRSAVVATALPTVTVSSTGISINNTGSARITWASTNASICNFFGGESGGDWTRQTALSGEYITRPITSATTFSMNCKNTVEYTVTSSVTVSKIVD